MGIIDFANGQPAPHELPNDLILQATQHLFETSGCETQGAAKRQRLDTRSGSSDPLSYGDFTLRFRTELSKFLGRCDASRAGVGPDPERLLPTAGVSQALDMLCTMCASSAKGDVVLVESPTYFLASAIFRDHGLEVRGVETDCQGILPEALSQALDALQAEHRRAALLYTIPVHHNPTGRTMSEERRIKMVDLARVHDTLVVADEVYTLLTYGNASPPQTLAALGDHVISISSFSKVLAHGLRVGWMEGAREQMKRLSKWAVIDSGGYISHFSSCTVASALELRLVDNHLLNLRRLYSERAAILCKTLSEKLPETCEPPELPRGGYFVWLQLPPTVTASKLAGASAGEEGVCFKEGVVFSPSKPTQDCGAWSNYIRICFARLTEAELVEGATRLCTAMKTVSAHAADEPLP